MRILHKPIDNFPKNIRYPDLYNELLEGNDPEVLSVEKIRNFLGKDLPISGDIVIDGKHFKGNDLNTLKGELPQTFTVCGSSLKKKI